MDFGSRGINDENGQNVLGLVGEYLLNFRGNFTLIIPSFRSRYFSFRLAGLAGGLRSLDVSSLDW